MLSFDRDSAAATLLLDLLPASCRYIRDDAELFGLSAALAPGRLLELEEGSLEADTLSLESSAIAALFPLKDPYQLLLLCRVGLLSSLNVLLLALLLMEAARMRGSNAVLFGSCAGVLGRTS